MTLSPYFRHLASQKRICPDCFKQTRIEETGSGNPNGAYEVCDHCGYFQSLSAPKNMEVPWDKDHPWDGKVPTSWMDEETPEEKTIAKLRKFQQIREMMKK